MKRNVLIRRALTILFFGMLVFSVYHAVRTVNAAIYWHNHRDEPIQSWMTIGYVAHSYHVPPHVLHEALGLPPEPDRRPLSEIADASGQSLDLIFARLNDAIVHARPPYPPPPPPRQPRP